MPDGPGSSDRIPRVATQDAGRVHQDVAYRIVTFFDALSDHFCYLDFFSRSSPPQPQLKQLVVWAPPVSFRRSGIDFLSLPAGNEMFQFPACTA